MWYNSFASWGWLCYVSDCLGGKRIAMIPWSGPSCSSTAAGNPIYYVEDLLGTSRVITTNAGVVCYDADFYPYGGERAYTNTCSQNYKFEGKERDTETGNDDFGARYYSNRFGRWLSADWSSVPVPVPYANLSNPQTLNLYAMVADDPESFADLDGHYCSNPNVPDGCGGGQVTDGKPPTPAAQAANDQKPQPAQQPQNQTGSAIKGLFEKDPGPPPPPKPPSAPVIEKAPADYKADVPPGSPGVQQLLNCTAQCLRQQGQSMTV